MLKTRFETLGIEEWMLTWTEFERKLNMWQLQDNYNRYRIKHYMKPNEIFIIEVIIQTRDEDNIKY